MITKCKPIEIARKKFSDFDTYEKNENQVFLVGYEIDSEGNKKNVKIDASAISNGNNSSNDVSHKTHKIETLSNISDDYYSYSTLGVTFKLEKCGDFIEIMNVSEKVLIDCESPEPDDVNGTKELIFTTTEDSSKIGKNTVIIMRNFAFPENCGTIYLVYDNNTIAEIDKDSEFSYVYIEIFHTHESNIVRALCY